MRISFEDGDNFIRNQVTIVCDGGPPTSPPARKLSRDEGLPVSVDDLAEDLRIDTDEFDATLERMERGAAAFLEKRTGFVLIPGLYQVDLPGWWSGPMQVMRGPLRELVSITYLDADGQTATADPDGFYVEEPDARSFTVRPLSTFDRPTLWAEVRRVRLQFTAGFRLPDESDGPPEMDDGLRTTLIMLVGHYYQNRELFAAGKLEAIETSGRDLLGAYRQFW